MKKFIKLFTVLLLNAVLIIGLNAGVCKILRNDEPLPKVHGHQPGLYKDVKSGNECDKKFIEGTKNLPESVKPQFSYTFNSKD